MHTNADTNLNIYSHPGPPVHLPIPYLYLLTYPVYLHFHFSNKITRQDIVVWSAYFATRPFWHEQISSSSIVNNLLWQKSTYWNISVLSGCRRYGCLFVTCSLFNQPCIKSASGLPFQSMTFERSLNTVLKVPTKLRKITTQVVVYHTVLELSMGLQAFT